jgi:hypothetical protein
VVFGRERVQRARDNGDEQVSALVVRFNPDTDELERLAAACLLLKGRHELQSHDPRVTSKASWCGRYSGRTTWPRATGPVAHSVGTGARLGERDRPLLRGAVLVCALQELRD